jgi:hypothetical protein
MALPVSERVDTYVTCQQRSAVVGMCSEKSWEEVDEDSKIDVCIGRIGVPVHTYGTWSPRFVHMICLQIHMLGTYVRRSNILRRD